MASHELTKPNKKVKIGVIIGITVLFLGAIAFVLFYSGKFNSVLQKDDSKVYASLTKTNYTVVDDLSGATFVIPSEYNKNNLYSGEITSELNKVITSSKASTDSAKSAVAKTFYENHSVINSNLGYYLLSKYDSFFAYAEYFIPKNNFDYITSFSDFKELYTNTSMNMKYKENTFLKNSGTNCIKMMNETSFQNSSLGSKQFYGYVSMIQDKTTKDAFCLVVGSTNNSSENMAKMNYVAKSFQFDPIQKPDSVALKRTLAEIAATSSATQSKTQSGTISGTNQNTQQNVKSSTQSSTSSTK